jgi:glycosyltransferase involved in cell wall biosynthesis
MIHQLSIIIPTLNEEKYLPQLLSCIAKQTYRGDLEVIVVDGQSTDKTVEMANTFKRDLQKLTVISSTRGIAHQRNIGAAKATYPYLLFLDADMKIPKFFLEKFLQKAKSHEQFIATTFCWVSEFDIFSYITVAIMIIPLLFIFLSEHFVPGFLILTTKENHEKIHGFNEALRIAEDLDYAERSYKNGARYQVFFYPYALHSARRLRKIGRWNFLLLYLTGFFYYKKYGPAVLNEKVEYPFGEY